MGSLRVFLSSTSSDLVVHRQAVRDAVLGLDQLPDDMAVWPSDARDGSTHSVDRVRQSDVVVLIVAHRYGHVPEGAEHSVTETEYRVARAASIPVLAFFLDPDAPWPPKHVEFDARDRLAAFRALVESEVTRSTFRTPDELARQVVQSLAVLLRQPRDAPGPRRFGRNVRAVSLPARLTADPDVLVPVGTSEDGLPLLLDVQRSRDLDGPLGDLARVVASWGHAASAGLVESFRRSLADLGREAWTAEGMQLVITPRGPKRRYVSSFTLSQPFTSVLAALVDAPVAGQRLRRPAASHVGAEQTLPRRPEEAAEDLRAMLMSSGGRNRFLAISPDDGTTSSVGLLAGDGPFVEWRPFLCESVLSVFPDARAAIRLQPYGPPRTAPLADAPSLAMEVLAREQSVRGSRATVRMQVSVPADAAVRMVAGVAGAVAKMHARGRLHGDLKPHNVLLVDGGPTLIDSFDVEPGDPTPGWSPGWSAPEQVLGQPVTPAADVYPLAVMLARLLGGELVGEVRRFRTPATAAGRDEFDVFHDPSLLLTDGVVGQTTPAGVEWRVFVDRCLRFDPGLRPQSAAEFAEELVDIAGRHPVPGTRSFDPSGELMAVRLLDGGDAVARVVVDRRVEPGDDISAADTVPVIARLPR